MNVPNVSPYYFCTYFDQGYLPRGLALYHSLKKYCPAFVLWILCMDELCYQSLKELNLPEVQLIALDEFEQGDNALLQAKENRSRIEYYFTCTPSLPLYILKKWSALDIITYLDADLFFFSDPLPLFIEMGQHSIAIIEHRFTVKLKYLVDKGIYNVGYLSFRNDTNGLKCLQWWRERCIEWCYDRVEHDRYGDQKYLDHWNNLFDGVIVLQNKGANLAPWNLANYAINSSNGIIYIDEQMLIFYHFQSLKPIRNWLYNPGLRGYMTTLSKVVKEDIYQVYIRVLLTVTNSKPVPKGIRTISHYTKAQEYFNFVRLVAVSGYGILTKQYIIVK